MRDERRTNRELPIVYSVIEWLDASGWPLVFPEVSVPRGLIRGRVDVAAASKGFRKSVAVEVKAIYRPGDPEGQLFDAGRAAEYVYLAAPPEVLGKTNVPASVGLLEAYPEGIRARLVVAREAKRGRPEPACRREFLHALIRSAMRRGRLDSTWIQGKLCPACSSGRCPFWAAPMGADIELVDLP
jgi:hypothetical protein